MQQTYAGTWGSAKGTLLSVLVCLVLMSVLQRSSFLVSSNLTLANLGAPRPGTSVGAYCCP